MTYEMRLQMQEESHKRRVVCVEDFKSKELFREAIKHKGFKAQKDAKAYYFMTLIGTVLEE
jgi:hypothetical protein